MFAILAAVFMFCEVLLDLLQPEIMSRIVDEGVLGAGHDGVGDLNLIWSLGLRMICLVLVGGLCGSLNNAFVHMTAQNIGNEMRKDAFRNIMTFSFPQVDRFGTGFKVTAVDKNHFRAAVDVAVSHVFYSWVFGFCGKVKIAAPKEVKNGYLEMVKKAME